MNCHYHIGKDKCMDAPQIVMGGLNTRPCLGDKCPRPWPVKTAEEKAKHWKRFSAPAEVLSHTETAPELKSDSLTAEKVETITVTKIKRVRRK